uniref:helix-turn-helix domain-containing protein n=1 Tax=Acetatifactor sp. TaxID=1872090 RepID=UPI004056DB42
MFPTINLRETGINLHRIMDKRGITPKDIKDHLHLTSVQSVYNWCNGHNMPTIDNLYALSQLLQVPIDAIICGNRKPIMLGPVINNARARRLYTYCKKINEMFAA